MSRGDFFLPKLILPTISINNLHTTMQQKQQLLTTKPQRNQKFVFKRFCKRCSTYFQPLGKENIYCLPCLKKSKSPKYYQIIHEIEKSKK